ncbi:CRTAC1 family protein [Patescibacteria group bacterium]|nr:CRTAC1 family protein [Patescibacteria group bacterium]
MIKRIITGNPASFIVVIATVIAFLTGISFWSFSRYWQTPDTLSGFSNILENSGIPHKGYGGAAWIDYDNDGFLDLFSNAKLYRNNHNDTFTDVTKHAGLDKSGYVIAAAFGDYDNDGCLDLYLSRNGKVASLDAPGASDLLYHNNCNGTFSEVSQHAGIKDLFHGHGVAWADYNNDGYLDIYVSNWYVAAQNANTADAAIKAYRFEPNILYRNNGDGTFTNITKEAGVIGNAQCDKLKEIADRITRKMMDVNLRFPYQPIWFDYNNDGRMDLFVATDNLVSPLYRNNGDGTFNDVTEEAGLCKLGTGMGVTVGDYDNNGYLDIYVTNHGKNYLWQNKGDGTFLEVAEKVGVADRGMGWGTAFFDYDNDGDLDLYVVNGTQNPAQFNKPGVKQNDLDELFQNNGDGTFTKITNEAGIYGNQPKAAAAFADYNNDGFIDIFVRGRRNNDEGRLYQNKKNRNNWLTLQLIGTKSNRDGVGARIIIKSGATSQIREVTSGDSYLAQNGLWQTFGLGSTSIVDTVEIIWPSGIKQKLHNIKVNQKMVITEKE